MGIPLPALSIRPPESPIQQVGGALQLASLAGGIQNQRLQQQQLQMELQSHKAVTQAFIKHNGNVDDDMISDAAKMGAQPEALQALQQHQLTMKNLLNTTEEGKLKIMASQHAAIGQEAQAILSLPQEKRQDAAKASIVKLSKQGILPPDQAQQEYMQVGSASPEDLNNYLQVHALGAMTAKDQIETALDARKVAAQETEAQVKAQSFASEMPGGARENPEQRYIRLKAMQDRGEKLTESEAAQLKSTAQYKTITPAFNFNLQQQGVAPSPGAVAGKTGQDFLSGLPVQRQNIIKGIAEGRVPMPSSFALKTPYWQSVMNDVMTYDPDFSTQRADLRKSFTTGKQSTEINAINTALGHVGVLGDATEALRNGNVQALNSIANKLGVQFGRTPATTLQAIVDRVGPELVKAYAGSGGGEAERQQVEKEFSTSMSPDQLRSNVSVTAKLLRSKIASLENQWNQNRAPGSPEFQDKFIMGDARRVVDKWAPEGKATATPNVIFARDPQGKLHQAPAGTALPPGWKAENR